MANLSNINGKFVVEQTTGYVGVGTTDPDYLLHLASTDTTNGTRLAIQNINTNGKTYGLISDNTGVFSLRDLTASTDRLTISSGGDATFLKNVTIGGHITSDGSAKVEGGGVPAMMGVTRITSGAGYTTGVKSTTGGSGTGMTVKVAAFTQSGGSPINLTVTIENPGSGYQIGDVLTISGGTAGNLATIKLVSGQSFTIFSTTSTGTQNALKPGVAFGYQDNVIAPGGVIAAANNSNSVATHTISSSMGGTQNFDIYTITDKRMYNVQAGWTITGSPVDTRPNTVVSYITEREVDFISFQVESPALEPAVGGPSSFPANNVFTFTGPNAANNLYFKTGRGRGYDTKMIMPGQGDTLLMIGINPTENQIINQGTFNDGIYNLLLMGQPSTQSVSNNPSVGGLKIENYNAAGTVTSSALFNATNCITGSGTFSGNLKIYNSTNAPYIDFVQSDSTSNSKARITMDQIDGSNGTLQFSTESAGTLSTRMTLSQHGQLKIIGSEGWSAANNTEVIGHSVLEISPVRNGTNNSLCVFAVAGNLAAIQAIDSSSNNLQSLPINPFGGNVGIGTSSPDALLDLEKGVNNAQGATLRLTNGNGGVGAGSAIEYFGPGTQGIHAKMITKDVGTYDSDFIIQTKASGTGSALADRITIKPNGNVVIPGNLNTGALTSGGSMMVNTNSSQAGMVAAYTGTGALSASVSAFNDTFAIYDETTPRYIFSYNPSTNYSYIYGKFFVMSMSGISSGDADVRYSTASGELRYLTSSKRYKTDIVSLEDSLDKINLLRPVRYKDIKSQNLACGLIAEETVKIIPEVVFTKKIEGFDEPQIEGINYTDLVPFLIKSIQELKAEIELLKKKSCTCNNCNCNK